MTSSQEQQQQNLKITELLQKAFTNVVELQSIELNSDSPSDTLIDIYQKEKIDLEETIKTLH